MDINQKAGYRRVGFILLLWLLSGCQTSVTTSDPDLDNSSDENFYEEITIEYANQKFADFNLFTDIQVVHEDGLGNNLKGIADINRVLMYRNEQGDFFVAYDVMIYKLGFDIASSNTWSGSSSFTLFIDNDNNSATGKVILDIGADIKISPGQSAWNSTNEEWESTWFELEPPLLGIHQTFASSGQISTDISSGQAYLRVVKKLGYLDALELAPSARAILQIEHNIIDDETSLLTTALLDSTVSFDISLMNSDFINNP